LPDGDILLVDVQRNELVRVGGANGAVVWRFAANGPIAAAPLVAGQQVVIATRDGEVIALDAASGAIAASAKLPQGVLATPAYDSSTGNLYVVADAHHAYVLSLADLTCKSAAYLGHEAGVDLAPVVAGGRLYVVENRGRAAVLYAISLAADGTLQGSPQQERLAGLVASSPLVLSSQLVIVTDKTAIIFELPASSTGRLRRAGELPSEDEAQASARYALAIGDRVWIGGAGLRQYGSDGSDELLAPISASFVDSSIVAPPQVVGAALIAVRQDAGKAATAFALQAADVKPLWESPLTQPANKAVQP
jgi:outer membrane protein assembly factor BamB